MEKLLVNPADAATMIGIGRTKMYELIDRGEFPVVRIGRAVRIPVEALREWVRSQQHNGSAA